MSLHINKTFLFLIICVPLMFMFTNCEQILPEDYDENEYEISSIDSKACKILSDSSTYKQLYKQRPSMAEFPNAECRNRGLHQFRVRGVEKVKAVALWHAVTFNFMRMLHLGCIG